MMMVYDIVFSVRPEHDRDHVFSKQFLLLLLRFMLTPALALFLDLSHSNGHLGRTKREDRHRLQERFACVGHGWHPVWLAKSLLEPRDYAMMAGWIKRLYIPDAS